MLNLDSMTNCDSAGQYRMLNAFQMPFSFISMKNKLAEIIHISQHEVNFIVLVKFCYDVGDVGQTFQTNSFWGKNGDR